MLINIGVIILCFGLIILEAVIPPYTLFSLIIVAVNSCNIGVQIGLIIFKKLQTNNY